MKWKQFLGYSLKNILPAIKEFREIDRYGKKVEREKERKTANPE